MGTTLRNKSDKRVARRVNHPVQPDGRAGVLAALNILAALTSPDAAPLPFPGVTQARISQGFSPSRLFPSYQGKHSIANVAAPSHLQTRFTVKY